MAGGHVRKITEIKKLETSECTYIDTSHFLLCCPKAKKELLLVCSVADFSAVFVVGGYCAVLFGDLCSCARSCKFHICK